MNLQPHKRDWEHIPGGLFVRHTNGGPTQGVGPLELKIGEDSMLPKAIDGLRWRDLTSLLACIEKWEATFAGRWMLSGFFQVYHSEDLRLSDCYRAYCTHKGRGCDQRDSNEWVSVLPTPSAYYPDFDGCSPDLYCRLPFRVRI